MRRRLWLKLTSLFIGARDISSRKTDNQSILLCVDSISILPAELVLSIIPTELLVISRIVIDILLRQEGCRIRMSGR